MVNRFLNWRTVFFLIAMGIVGATIYYTNYLAKKIDKEERQRVAEWISANTLLQQANDPAAISLSNMVIRNNEDMPLVATDNMGTIIDYHNIDSLKTALDPNYPAKVLEMIKEIHDPIEWEIGPLPEDKYFVYYGNTLLQKEVQYYPIVQLFLVALFIALLVSLLNIQNRSTQNQVWAGMAKETAHQMGTPLTSLQGWLEVLKEQQPDSEIQVEMHKDVERLKLVSDRFSKIGSIPKFETENLLKVCGSIIEYMKHRSPNSVNFILNCDSQEVFIDMSPTLLEWVFENLIKNALDALEGHGTIKINIRDELTNVVVDIIDSGKGISPANLTKVFNPGFSTKKRGWGLGLTLCKRIVEQYHKGQLFVKYSEPGKGTTFRMVLPR